MKNEIESLQTSFQDAGRLLDDALDILTRRDEKHFSQDDMHAAMNKLFKLRDKYFLGFTNWNQPQITVNVTGQLDADDLMKRVNEIYSKVCML